MNKARKIIENRLRQERKMLRQYRTAREYAKCIETIAAIKTLEYIRDELEELGIFC